MNRSVAAAVLVLFVCQSAGGFHAAAVEWPTYLGGYHRASGVTDSAHVGGAWQVELGRHGFGGDAAAAVDGRIIVPAPDGPTRDPWSGAPVQARRIDDGALEWSSNRYLKTPAISGEVAFFAERHDVVALHVNNGTVLWNTTLSGGWGLIAAQGLVFVPLASEVVALQMATGAVRWAYPIEGERISMITLDGSALFFATATSLHRLDALTGVERWRVDAHVGGGSPVVTGGHVIVATHTGIAAFDTETGAPAWIIQLNLPPAGNMALGDGFVYLPTRKNLSAELVAIRLDVQTVAWRLPIRAGGLTPVVVDDVVYFTDVRGVLALDGGTGRILGVLDVGDHVITGTPIVVGDHVILRTYRMVEDDERILTLADMLGAYHMPLDESRRSFAWAVDVAALAIVIGVGAFIAWAWAGRKPQIPPPP